jgi:hypothetical protein
VKLTIVADKENGEFHVYGPGFNLFEPPEPLASFQTCAEAEAYAAEKNYAEHGCVADHGNASFCTCWGPK